MLLSNEMLYSFSLQRESNGPFVVVNTVHGLILRLVFALRRYVGPSVGPSASVACLVTLADNLLK